MIIKRETGCYWVCQKKSWSVAIWDSSRRKWWLNSIMLVDSDFTEIDERHIAKTALRRLYRQKIEETVANARKRRLTSDAQQVTPVITETGART